jgi:hypothetical protein
MRITQTKTKTQTKRKRETQTQIKRDRQQLSQHLRVVQYAYNSVSPKNPDDIDDEDLDTDHSVWCPSCRHEMTSEEVQEKFRNDTVDITTGCPECGERFETSFLMNECRFVWLCKDQTKDQFNLWIDEKETSFKDNYEKMFRSLKTERPEIYFNAVCYCPMPIDKKEMAGFLEFLKPDQDSSSSSESDQESSSESN